eukprot:gene1813-16303_t
MANLEVSHGEITPKKFKTPMSFSPRVVPSPSRKELWKQELGFDDAEIMSDDTLSSEEDEPEADQNGNKRGGHSKVEIEALELELERKEKQKEEILSKLKDSLDKVKSYKHEMERAQQSKRNQLKIMKKTYETHLNEKEETIQSLHGIIEEQDNKIIELHSKMVGESSTEDDLSIYHSVKKLVDKLSHLQQEKAHLTSSLMKMQGRMSKLEEEQEAKLNSVDEEKRTIERANRKLEKEIRDLKISAGNGGPSFQDNATIEQLEKEKRVLMSNLSDMENELNDHKKRNLEWEHRFESEVSVLRSNIRQTEAKFQEVAATPPKVIYKTVIPEENIQKIEDLETKNRWLEKQLASSREQNESEVSSLKEKIERVKKDNDCFSGESAKYKTQTVKLEKELNEMKNVTKLYEDEKNKCERLSDELQKSSQSFIELEETSKRKLDLLSVEMETRVSETERRTVAKFSNMIKSFEEMKEGLKEMQVVARTLKKEESRARKDIQAFAGIIKPTVQETKKMITQAIADVDERSKSLVDRYRREMKLRKKYFNQLVELKGNIRVFCRVRPSIKEDGSGQAAENVMSYDFEDDALIYVEHRGNNKEFEVDRVFRPESTQEEVFNEVKPLVTSCIDGYNVCIFAYGQTGSGKTFTMEGSHENPGINPRALQLLFDEVQDKLDWDYSLTVSLMEIYNESLKDLLTLQPLEIKQSKEGVFVPCLEEVEVKNADDVRRVFDLGHKNRFTASTNMNEYSSRSHAVLVINVIGKNKNTGAKTVGKLNLVDLAGSERVSKSGAEGARMKEAQSINKSLSALGDVIQALKGKSSHIPYRNSKLTYLLQNSLGGDSKTLMVVQVAPVRKNAGETFCSLDFASRVRNVELGQATKKVESVDSPYKSDTPTKSKTPKKRT